MQTAYQNYKKQEVEGATKGKIVVLLFEGTIKFLRKASKAIDENNIQEGTEIIVWFKNANKATSPCLRINNNAKSDSMIGYSLTENGGFYAHHNGDWNDGEIIHLVYMTGSNYHYWMMTDKGVASTTTYGVVKLSSTYNDKDNMTALTGEALKSTIDDLQKSIENVIDSNISVVEETLFIG